MRFDSMAHLEAAGAIAFFVRLTVVRQGGEYDLATCVAMDRAGRDQVMLGPLEPPRERKACVRSPGVALQLEDPGSFGDGPGSMVALAGGECAAYRASVQTLGGEIVPSPMPQVGRPDKRGESGPDCQSPLDRDLGGVQVAQFQLGIGEHEQGPDVVAPGREDGAGLDHHRLERVPVEQGQGVQVARLHVAGRAGQGGAGAGQHRCIALGVAMSVDRPFGAQPGGGVRVDRGHQRKSDA